MSKAAIHFTWSVVMLVALAAPAGAATPVHINFDNLAPNTIVNCQYGPQVTFSSENMTVYPTFAYNYCGYCISQRD
jgi:hypothetical protein